MEQSIHHDEEDAAEGPGLEGLPDGGQPDELGEEDLIAMEVKRAAMMLGLNWGDEFYEHDLNQRNRKWHFYYIWM